MASQPIDQGSILASGRALVPDYAAQLVQQQLLGIRQQEANTNALQATTVATHQQREQQQEQQFQEAVAALGDHPSVSQLSALAVRFPHFSEAVRRGWEMQDQGRRDTDFRQMAEIHDAARGGHYEVAAQSLRQRIEAEHAANPEAAPDPMDQAILDGLTSHNPQDQQAAVDLLERMVATIAGPEHYASVYGTYSRDLGEMNGILYDKRTGEAVYQDPRGRIIPGQNGAFWRQGIVPGIPTLGGAPGSTVEGSTTGEGAAAPAPPAAGAGSGGSRPASAASLNNPGGLRATDWTRAQPGFAGVGGNGYARFETPQQGIAAQERLLRSHYLARPTTIRQIIHRYAPPRSAGGDNTEEQVANYIAHVARRMGVSADQPIDATMTHVLAQAMREFETGTRPRGRIQNSDVPHISSRQQYDRLAHGARYIAPDGTIRTKP